MINRGTNKILQIVKLRIKNSILKTNELQINFKQNK